MSWIHNIGAPVNPAAVETSTPSEKRPLRPLKASE